MALGMEKKHNRHQTATSSSFILTMHPSGSIRHKVSTCLYTPPQGITVTDGIIYICQGPYKIKEITLSKIKNTGGEIDYVNKVTFRANRAILL